MAAAERMRELGYVDAVAVPGGPDGGIDVRASRAVGQVKWQQMQVGRPQLQNLYGARAGDSTKEMWFFAKGNYSTLAVRYADQVGMLLFQLNFVGQLAAVNDLAAMKLASHGP